MITLRGKLKKDTDIANSKNKDYNKRASIRDKLLIKEVILHRFLYIIQDDIFLLVCKI